MRRFWLLVISYWLLFVSWNLLFGISVIYAASQFKSSIAISYIYDDNGVPVITQNISLKNLTSEKYVTSYQFTVPGDIPKNISGRDSLGPLKIVSAPDDFGGTLVTVNFNDQAVGLGKNLEFSLDYTGQPALHRGQVWQVVIPTLSTPQLFDSYQLSLTVPSSFGLAASLSPLPDISKGNTYVYTSLPTSKVPVQGAFGNFQSFNFSLSFSLTNPHSSTAVSQIPLPPDTSYQHVVYSLLSPRPDNVVVDQDGNWLAHYRLAPRQKLRVTATGQSYIQPVPVFSTLAQTNIDLSEFKKPTANWPSDNPDIQALAKKYSTPDAILAYVNNLPDKKTSMFVAIARAAGFAAREVYGYTYPDNIYQSWPQYWDSQSQNWLSLNFDINHFSYYFSGISLLEFTPPVITITTAPYSDPLHSPATFSWTKPFQFIPLSQTRSSLEISNSSGQAIYDLPVSVAAQNLSLQPPTATTIPILPPYSHYSFPVIFNGDLLPDFSSKYLAVSVNNQQMTYNISNTLFLFWHAVVTVTFSILIIFVAFLATKAWGLYFQEQGSRHHLRRQGQKSP